MNDSAKEVLARMTGSITCPDCKSVCLDVIVEKFDTRLFHIDLKTRELTALPEHLDWSTNDWAFHCPHCDSLNVDSVIREAGINIDPGRLYQFCMKRMTKEVKRQIITDVKLRLTGNDVADAKRIRQMTYYQRWQEIADWLDTNPSKKAIMEKIHWAKDEPSYGYAWKSVKSYEALEFVARERNWK